MKQIQIELPKNSIAEEIREKAERVLHRFS